MRRVSPLCKGALPVHAGPPCVTSGSGRGAPSVANEALQGIRVRLMGIVRCRRRPYRTFRLPAYARDLNPAEGVWANLKNDLGNLAARTVDALAPTSPAPG